MVLPTSCFLLATLFNTAKGIDENFFASDQSIDLASDKTGTMTLSLTIETSSIIEITKDGTNWEEINDGVAIDANREFIHKFAALTNDTVNFRAKTATTVRRAILQVDSQEGPAIPPGAGGGVGDNLGNHIATQDLDMDGFSIIDLDTIQFRDNVTPPANNIPYIYWETLGAGIQINVPTGDRIAFKRNGVEQIRIDTLGNLEMLGNSIEMGSGLISFIDSNKFIIQSGVDIGVFLPTGSAFDVVINSLNEYQFEETNAIWNGNNITELSNIVFQNTVLAPLATEPAIWADTGGVNINVPNIDAVTFSVNGVDEYRFSATLFDMNGNRIVDTERIESNDANHATLGFIRMGVLETIGWRNSGDTNNNLISFAGDVFSISFDLVDKFFFTSTELDMSGQNIIDVGYIESLSATAASAGFIRMDHLEEIAWRRYDNLADDKIFMDAFGGLNIVLTDTFGTIIFNLNGTNEFSFGTANFNMGGNFINQLGATGTAAALSGVLRIGNNQLAKWRNAAASADIGMGLNASDNFIFEADIDLGSNNLLSVGTLNSHTIPGGTDTFAMLAASQTLTNKTIDSSLNTITNIVNADIAASAAIAVSKLEDGTAYQRIRTNAGATANEFFTETAAIEFVIDGGGSTITTGVKGDIEVPFDCEIEAATLLADQSGSIVVQVWSDTYANYPPVLADAIYGSAPPTITTAIKSQDTTLTGWTKTLTKGDTLRFNVSSVTSIQRVTLSLRVIKRG